MENKKTKNSILNDILNDNVSIKVNKNEDNTVIVNVLDKKKEDKFSSIKLDVKNQDLSLGNITLLLLEHLNESSKNNYKPNNEYQDLENVSSYFPSTQSLLNGKDNMLEKFLKKMSSSHHELPKLRYDDKNPRLFKFEDGSAIYLKRNVISGSDGPADCGSLLISTTNVKQLESKLLETYIVEQEKNKEFAPFGDDLKKYKTKEALKEAIENPKPTLLKSALNLINGKHEPSIKFDASVAKNLREKFHSQKNVDKPKLN